MSLTEPDATAAPALPATLRMGPVHLTVTHLDRSVAFYQDVIGLHVHRRDEHTAALGAAGEDLLVLHEDPSARPPGRHAGLYHVALLHPSRRELARAALRLAATRTPIDGASDHGISEAFYLPDPDGNGIELAADRPREVWPDLSDPGWDGGPKPMDVEGLLALVAGEEPARHADPGLSVGHVHLHGTTVDAGLAFYRDVLGFEVMTRLPTAAFVSAGGYHHHVAFNTWRGRGVPPAPAGIVGLRHFTIVLPEPADVDAVRARVEAAGLDATPREAGFAVRDPFGLDVVVEHRPAGPERRSRAVVRTAKPSPYLKQISKHFAHKLPVTFDDRTGTIPFAFGRAELLAGEDALVIDAVAAREDDLARVRSVIGSHLERFGRRDELVVEWDGDTPEG